MAKFAGFVLLAVATVLLSDNAEGFGMLRLGGMGKERPANEKIKNLVSKVQRETGPLLLQHVLCFYGL